MSAGDSDVILVAFAAAIGVILLGTGLRGLRRRLRRLRRFVRRRSRRDGHYLDFYRLVDEGTSESAEDAGKVRRPTYLPVRHRRRRA